MRLLCFLLCCSQAFSSEKILFLGDSVTHGVRDGVIESQTFRAIIAQKLKCLCVDGGVGGDSAPMGLARLEQLLISSRPTHVVIMFGINDALGPHSATIDEYRDAITQMVRLCRRYGSWVVLCTPNPLNGDFYSDNAKLKPYVSAARALTLKLKLKSADIYQAFAESNLDTTPLDQLMQDGQHPNSAGHLLISDEVIKALKR